MTDLVLALMALLLGAATLAIVLLYRGWKSNRELITELRAEVATQQIAALTGGVPIPALTTNAPQQEEPVRRKRHLALYLGSGVLAVFTAIRDRLRALWHGHRALTVTAAATIATMGTAAALIMPPAGGSTPGDSNHGGTPAAELPRPGRVAGTPDDNSDQSDTENAPTVLTDNAVDPLALHGKSGIHRPSSALGLSSQAAEGNTGKGTEDPDPTPPTGQPETPAPTQAPSPEPGTPEPSAPSASPEPAEPAHLTVSTIQLADTDRRWCENVTVDISNTGGTSASGTLTFGTHIIGPLGLDWGTITQSRNLPSPIPAGGASANTWTLCVDSWRVPYGWHIDTLDVALAQN